MRYKTIHPITICKVSQAGRMQMRLCCNFFSSTQQRCLWELSGWKDFEIALLTMDDQLYGQCARLQSALPPTDPVRRGIGASQRSAPVTSLKCPTTVGKHDLKGNPYQDPVCMCVCVWSEPSGPDGTCALWWIYEDEQTPARMIFGSRQTSRHLETRREWMGTLSHTHMHTLIHDLWGLASHKLEQ